MPISTLHDIPYLVIMRLIFLGPKRMIHHLTPFITHKITKVGIRADIDTVAISKN